LYKINITFANLAIKNMLMLINIKNKNLKTFFAPYGFWKHFY